MSRAGDQLTACPHHERSVAQPGVFEGFAGGPDAFEAFTLGETCDWRRPKGHQ
jgi:hypothetical protein